MEIYRSGDFRVCPSCGARHKVQDLACSRCSASLVGAPVRRATPLRIRTAGAPSNLTMRGVMVAGLVLALGAGLWVRSVFRGAALEQSVSAAVRPSDGPPAAPAAAADWTPPALNYPMTPPLRPALTALPSTTGTPLEGSSLTPMVGAALAPATTAGVPTSGMVSITPSNAGPSGRRSFTDEDLARMRTQGYSGAAPVAAGAAPVSAGAAPVSAAPGPNEDTVRDWTERIRDRADDAQEAKAAARQLEVEITALKARAGLSPDAGEREKIDNDLKNAVDELERAERKVRDAERRLDETKADARRDGVRVQ